MMHIRHHIPDAKYRKPDARAASVLLNVTRRKIKRHGIIATAGEVWDATRRLGDGSCLFLRERVFGSVRSVRAIRNTRVLLTGTRFIADDTHPSILPPPPMCSRTSMSECIALSSIRLC